MTDQIHFGEKAENAQPSDLEVANEVLGPDSDAKVVARRSKVSIKAMLAAWVAGVGYAALAERFELRDAAQARRMIDRALAESLDTKADRSVLIARVDLGYDSLLRSVIGKALDGQNPEQRSYVETALKVYDRKVALHGLNAPTNIHLTAPNDEELNRFIAAVAAANGAAIPVEGDPFAEDIEDAEVVEDE